MGKGFFFNRYAVLPEQYGFITNLIKRYNEPTQYLFKHILVSNIYQRHDHDSSEDPTYSPIPSKLIKKYAPGADWKALREGDLLLATNYSRKKHRCREFQVMERILDEFLSVRANHSAKEYVRTRRIDLFSGRRMKTRKKSRLYDSSMHPEPELIRGAIGVLGKNKCPFNLNAIEKHFDRLRGEVDNAARLYGLDSRPHREAKARYINDDSCMRSVLDLDADLISNDLWQYTPAYLTISTGRIHQHLGGLQSCSREMKAAAYSEIVGLNNYDLKDSQLHCLIQELKGANFDTGWLDEYLSTPNSKEAYAKLVGVSADCWKRCLIALAMGAHLPKRVNGFEHRENRILNNLAEEAGEDQEVLQHLLTKFARIVAPLVGVLKEWHKWLLAEYIPKSQTHGRGGARITNKCGKKLDVGALPRGKDEWRARSKVAAFILQGQEAAFVHHLTLLGEEYGYRPIANEHDGLVVIGEVPNSAVEAAAGRSGLQSAELIKKNFI